MEVFFIKPIWRISRYEGRYGLVVIVILTREIKIHSSYIPHISIYSLGARFNGKEKKRALNEYIETQEELRNNIEENNEKQTKALIYKIKLEGGSKSKTFWDTKRKLTGKGANKEYPTITENGSEIADPDEAKEHIANY